MRASLTKQHVLADEGRFYLVAIEQNDPNRIIQELQIKHLHAEVSRFHPIMLNVDHSASAGRSGAAVRDTRGQILCACMIKLCSILR